MPLKEINHMKRESHLNPSLALTTSIKAHAHTNHSMRSYYTQTYIKDNNTYTNCFGNDRYKKNDYIDHLNLFYSLHFYPDKIKFCLKSNINQMFTINRMKTLSLENFINKNLNLILLLDQSNIILNIHESLYINNIKDINKLIENLSINFFIGNLGNKLYYSSLFYSYYNRYKHIRRAVSALQKMGYLKYSLKCSGYCIYKDDNL